MVKGIKNDNPEDVDVFKEHMDVLRGTVVVTDGWKPGLRLHHV